MNSSSRFSMSDLMGRSFAPIQYVIPGIIPEGLTILAAPPKVGKSWLVLDLAYQLATSGTALGAVPVDRARPVLYLALEDTPRRLQARLRHLDVAEAPDTLYFQTEVPPGEVLEQAITFMNDHHDQAPVVIVDTLGKVAPPANAGESDYMRDYRVGGGLKNVADSVSGGSVIVVHHTRKAAGDDFLDSVSGTQGLAGSADSILVLRRERNTDRGSLSVTSRDAVEGEYAVNRDGVKWVLVGGELTQAAVALANDRMTENLGELSAEVIDFVNSHPQGVDAAQVASGLEIATPTARTYLARAFAAGRLEKPKRGLYTPVTSVMTVASDHPNDTLDTLVTEVYEAYCVHGVTLGSRCSKAGCDGKAARS